MNKGFFSKSILEQSVNGSAQTQEGMSSSMESGQGAYVSGAPISIDQVLRMATDALIFPEEGVDFNAIVDQFENILILHALERTSWNRNRAAGLLRLNRTTLVEKLKKKQLMPPMGGEIELSGNA